MIMRKGCYINLIYNFAFSFVCFFSYCTVKYLPGMRDQLQLACNSISSFIYTIASVAICVGLALARAL